MSERPHSADGYRHVDPDSVEDLHEGTAPAALRVDPQTPRTHRNEGDEPAEMWAVLPWIAESDSAKYSGFWDPSPDAERRAR